MRAVDIILKKRDGGALSPAEIEGFIEGVTAGSLPDYQASALLMAILLRGMTAEETTALTEAMIRSGSRLDLSDIPGPKVDKHSTGGVGDKSSLVIAPLVAASGALVPMMSGRGLGHTGGTLDKLEAIPGFRTNLSIPEMKAALAATGCVLIGQSAAIAPADKKLYALRDVTGTIESIPLISASIMSKKIAEGIDALVLDVKTGAGAFMKTASDARRLAESLVRIGKAAGVRTQAVITAMDWPIGRAVGNANEVIEAIEVLKGRGPVDLIEGSFDLSERMLVSAGVAKTRSEARALCRNAIDSGRAVEKFRAIIERQGGDPRVIDDYARLPTAPEAHVVGAPAAGFVTALDAGLIGRASVALGGGRDTVDEAIDPGVGIMIRATVGDAVQRGDAILELHYREASRLQAALPLAARAVEVGPVRRSEKNLIVSEIL
ncbi:MAG: thymidine phosphorylase [Acidobacteria bacterium]|nr:thymidine phosphorylase [Acidobacteriota bacterium]